MKKAFTPTPKKQNVSVKPSRNKFLVRGFTLIELIIAIVLITLIVLAIIFAFSPKRSKSNFAQKVSSILNIGRHL